MKTSSQTSSEWTLSLKHHWFWCFIYLASAFVAAVAQPDRHFILGLVGYIFGYAGIFYSGLFIKKAVSRFWAFFVWASVVQLFQLSWLSVTHYHGLAILWVYLLLSLGIALQFAALSLFFSKDKVPSIMRSLCVASVWAIIEWSRMFYLCGFPFNSLGLVMTFHPHPMQMASLVGIYGLSFWVIFVSLLGTRFLCKKTKMSAFLWISGLIAPAIFGYMHIEKHVSQQKLARKLQVALVQTGLCAEQKWCFPGEEKQFITPLQQWRRISQFIKGTKKDNFDLIVLPEVALPGEVYDTFFHLDRVVSTLSLEKQYLPALQEPLARKNDQEEWLVTHAWIAQALSNQYKSEMVIGFLDYEEKTELSFNSAFHFRPFTTKQSRYDKRVLVPMSEYLPLPMLSSFIAKYGITTFFTHGAEAKVFSGTVPLAVSICYEEGYNHLIREGVKNGAELLINISNDGWFPSSRLPIEHYNLGKLRAVENGVPLLRACNTGITAAVDSFGRTVFSMKDINEQGELLSGISVGEINCYTLETVYSQLGNSLILYISSLCIIFFFLYRKFCNI